ncbi:MAG: methyltransferase domain-containing protein [Candidatus Omnitrophota bacterium]
MKKIKCDLCGSDNYSVVYKTYRGDLSAGASGYKITDHDLHAPMRVVKCRKCGLVYTNPRIHEQELECNYSDMVDESYLAEERGRRLSARAVLKVLKKYRKSGNKLLDIGCATGLLLDEARKDGWEVYGVELSRWAVAFARDMLRLEHIFEGALVEANFPANFFDVVVLKDTIEHLLSPRETLVAIRKILKPSGILCVNTPNIQSWISRMLGAKWWGVKQAHLYYYTPRTLEKMLRSTGFVPLRLRSHARAFTLNYWLEKLGLYHKLLYKIFAFLKKYKVSHALVTVNLGDQMEVFARKSRKLEYLQELEAACEATEQKKAKVVVVLPAYNAATTLPKTVEDIPKDMVDDIILVDDRSQDETVKIAKQLGLKTVVHKKNRGYGGNQKTCYTKALEEGADIVVMVHPDYQYDPKVIPELIEPIRRGHADAVFGSRMMKRGALEGGMPLWKHNANVFLTALENVVLGTYLTEYHSGFRAYSAKYLKHVNFLLDSDGFIFDTEIIVQGLLKHMRIEEVPIRTRYFDEASTIRLWPSICYGLGILKTLAKFKLHQSGIFRFKQFA